jgi:hypothetical protein
LDSSRGWRAAATDRAILARSLGTCLFVGALLTTINQGDRLIRGELDAAMVLKIGLTFLVPFVVATMSGAAAIRGRPDHEHGASDASTERSSRSIG